MGYEEPQSGAARVAKRRAALRAQGLRPRTFWLPDTTTEAFKDQAERDCEYLWSRVSADTEMMAFVEAMTEELLATLDPYEPGSLTEEDS